ncbi:MAG: 4-(cytidine 5'-diphospho)-2-C-methyl-D-erythritol kinase [Acidobacteriia bacterium]|nr:4-(cytidine 5'-diphospho)-2-C-methyl-D-erythritol kinase [Terriglobia bacterium]
MSASSGPRRACVRALAKINLHLRVLGKRADGYHELRTVFQTISLADVIDICFTPGRETAIELVDDPGIPDNLVLRAARVAMEAMGAAGRVEIRLVKRIPMGAGLGGGSSDAAAVLMSLPVLAGRRVAAQELRRMAAALGSDVPFFLLGGAAAGIGRGTELFPLPDGPAPAALIAALPVHVDTARAYAALSPRLTSESQQNKIFSFQSHTWALRAGGEAANDFEEVVFEQYPALATVKRALMGAGASAAMMTGSGSAVFGLFSTREEASRALRQLRKPKGFFTEKQVFRVSLVSRGRYRSLWGRALAEHAAPGIWPPQSRY